MISNNNSSIWLMTILVIIIFNSCSRYKSIKPIGPIQTSFKITSNFQIVWDNLIDIIIDENFQLENTEKESGIITTKAKKLTGKVASIYTYHEYNVLYEMLEEFEQINTFRVKKLENGYTEIKIHSSYQGKNIGSDGEIKLIKLETNGNFELKIIEALNSTNKDF